jgi:predicted TIM-barrel fold metal-dependent hydrolase
MSNLADSVRVIDADAHLTEPPELWIENLPRQWRAQAPHVEMDQDTGISRWRIAGRWLHGPGSVSHAGWKDFPPSRPPTFADIQTSCWDATDRARWMDENSVAAQVLYPNVTAFEGHAIMALEDEELKLAILRVYNDYVADFAKQKPGRFIPVASVPFWDIDASIAEMQRCAELGHRGVLWAATLSRHGLPGSTDPYWDRFYAAAQDANQSINFHVGVGWTEEEFAQVSGRQDKGFDRRAATGRTAQSWLSNAKTITDFIMDGVCERFPDLDFVSVESGFGWIPFLLEGLDWQWKNYDGPRVEGGLLPSEYFRRQFYSMFWFEEAPLRMMAEYQDNVMFETDFPHTTSLSPGPGSASPSPAAVIERARQVLDPVTFEKVMYANAARVYRLGR